MWREMGLFGLEVRGWGAGVGTWSPDFCGAEELCPHSVCWRLLSVLVASCGRFLLQYWAIDTPGNNTQPVTYGNWWVQPQLLSPLGGLTVRHVLYPRQAVM